MFAKLAIAVSTLAIFAAAAPHDSGNVSQCNTGDAQCCNTVQSSEEEVTSEILSLLGISVAGITGQVGLGCTPISVIGAGQGANCAQQPVCCQGNNFNGLVNVGCTPISL